MRIIDWQENVPISKWPKWMKKIVEEKDARGGQMDYGTISVKTIMIAGKVTKSFVVYDESLPIHSEVEAAEMFYEMLEQLKRGKLINPGIQVEVYPDTGRIKRVVKSWTEVK